jgi:DNA polymerase-3 subunit beta
MQLVSTTRDILLNPLQVVSGIVERRHTLPILANLLLKKNKEKISFISTDIDIQITTTTDFGIGSEEISTTVGARKLLDILRAMPEGPVNLNLKDNRMVVQSGKSRFSLQTLAANEFPMMQENLQDVRSLNMTQHDFKQLISQVYFAMAQQDIRYYLNGMLFVLEGSKLIAVATDGHRLAYGQIILSQPVTGDLAKIEVIVPRKTILECQHLLEDSDEVLNIQISPSQIKFSFGTIELLSKLVEGKFPDYQRVIPKGHKNMVIVKREGFQAALQRAAILTTDKFKGIRCSLKNNLLLVQSTNAEQEEAQEEIETIYSGDEIDIGFNVTYLLDVLSNVKNEEIQLSLGDSNSSALINIPENENFKYVVMPMRI